MTIWYKHVHKLELQKFFLRLVLMNNFSNLIDKINIFIILNSIDYENKRTNLVKGFIFSLNLKRYDLFWCI